MLATTIKDAVLQKGTDRPYNRIELRYADTYLQVLQTMSPHADFARFTISKLGVEMTFSSDALDWRQRCVGDIRCIVNCSWDYLHIPPVHVALNIHYHCKKLERLLQDQSRNQDMNLVLEFNQNQLFRVSIEAHIQLQTGNGNGNETLAAKKVKKPRKSRSQRQDVMMDSTPYHVDSRHRHYRTYEEQDDEDQVRRRMLEESEMEKKKEAETQRLYNAEFHAWLKNDLQHIQQTLDFSDQDQRRHILQGQPIAPFVISNFPSGELDYAFQSGENAFVNPYIRIRATPHTFETSANGEAGYIHFLLVAKGEHEFFSQLHQRYQHEYHSQDAKTRLGSGIDMITTDFWTYTVERVERAKRHTEPLQIETHSCPTLDQQCVFVRILRFHLVPFFTVACWKRYGYSANDVHLTCKPFRSCLLWLVPISNRIPLEASAVKASNAVEYVMVWGAKSNAINTIKNKYIPKVYPQIEDIKESVLCRTIKEHKPCLPIVTAEQLVAHSGSPTILTDCLAMLPEKQQLAASVLPVPRVFSWKDIEFLPRRKESHGKFMYCVRVVPEQVYTEIHGEPTCIALKRQSVVLPNGMSYGLGEEAFLVPLPAPEKAKRKRAGAEPSTTGEPSRKKARMTFKI